MEVVSVLHDPDFPFHSVDALDIRLLRAMFPGGVFAISGIGPGWSMTQLARTARTSRLTARRRLARWRDEGFWTKVLVYPHPATLGCSFQIQMFRVRGSGSIEAFDEFAQTALRTLMYFQTDNVLGPLCLVPETKPKGPRRKLPRGVEALSPPSAVAFPAPDGSLRRSDWAILRALRRSSELEWGAIARSLHMTERGVRRRVKQLSDARLLFFLPMTDFRSSHGSITMVAPLIRAEGDDAVVRRALFTRCPDALEVEQVTPPDALLPPEIRGKGTRWLTFMVPTASIAEVDGIRQDLAAVAGVFDTYVSFPVRTVELPGTLDRVLPRFAS
jgi:DNA-binding Lrp family transcriptional regulator